MWQGGVGSSVSSWSGSLEEVISALASFLANLVTLTIMFAFLIIGLSVNKQEQFTLDSCGTTHFGRCVSGMRILPAHQLFSSSLFIHGSWPKFLAVSLPCRNQPNKAGKMAQSLRICTVLDVTSAPRVLISRFTNACNSLSRCLCLATQSSLFTHTQFRIKWIY